MGRLGSSRLGAAGEGGELKNFNAVRRSAAVRSTFGSGCCDVPWAASRRYRFAMSCVIGENDHRDPKSAATNEFIRSAIAERKDPKRHLVRVVVFATICPLSLAQGRTEKGRS
jgi:hypothetical protein